MVPFLHSPSFPASSASPASLCSYRSPPVCGTLIGIALKLIDSLVKHEARCSAPGPVLPGPAPLFVNRFIWSELKLSGLFVAVVSLDLCALKWDGDGVG